MISNLEQMEYQTSLECHLEAIAHL
jgi:hypothetical protein